MRSGFRMLAGILCGSLAAVTHALAQTTIIHAGHMLDVAGTVPKSEQSIIIRNGRIAGVREGYVDGGAIDADDALTVDLRDRFVMAGLIDTHVHLTTEPKPGGSLETVTLSDADLALRAAVNARALLEAGFTTVMDMGTGRRAHESAIYAVRDAIARGDIDGPEILAAGSPISATGLSRTGRFRDGVEAAVGPEGVCNGADDCRRAVREQIRRGADFINFYNTGSLLTAGSAAQALTLEEMQAIVETAHALGRIAVADGGNTPGDPSGIHAAIRAGADIVDTVTYPTAESFALMKSHGTVMAPHVYALEAAVGDTPETLETGSMGWLPRPLPESLFALKQQESSALPAYAAGVRLALAADSGVFQHGLNAREIVSYAGLGIPVDAALAAATINAARAHDILDRVGTIETGKEADIIAMDASPFEDVEAVTEIRFVMANGHILKADDARLRH